jgi:chloramphenicol-sensitive protein RarD
MSHSPLHPLFLRLSFDLTGMKFSKYYLAALVSFTIWGFFSFVLKALHTYASIDILFYRVFFCSVLMLIISFIFRVKVLKANYTLFKTLPVKKKKEVVALTLLGGLLLTANWFFFIYAVNHISVKAGSLAYLVCPILTTVLAYFMLHEKLNRWQWAAVALSAFSCGLLSIDHVMDLLYSLIIASSYALYLVSQRKSSGFDKFLLLTFQILFSSLILLPFYPVYSAAVPSEISFYLLIMVIAVVFTIAPLFMNLYALQGVNSSTMGILLYINPLIGFFIAVFYFKEEITGLQLAAYGLILVAIMMFNKEQLFRNKKELARV